MDGHESPLCGACGCACRGRRPVPTSVVRDMVVFILCFVMFTVYQVYTGGFLGGRDRVAVDVEVA
jgi:hypothetical protein